MGDTPPAFAARLVDLSAPGSLAEGDTAGAWAEFRNVGLEAWPAGDVMLRARIDGEGVSPLWPDGHWPAWNIAAVLGEAVPPDGTARFEFPVGLVDAMAAASATTFYLTVGEDPVQCPAPTFSLSVVAIESGKPDRPEEAPMRSVIASPTEIGESDDPQQPAGAEPSGGTGGATTSAGGDAVSGCQAADAPRPAGPLALLMSALVVLGIRRFSSRERPSRRSSR